MKDITGQSPVKKQRGKAPGDDPQGVVSKEERDAQREAGQGATAKDGGERWGEKQAPNKQKAATDSTNVVFEKWLRGRQPRDFLAEQVTGGKKTKARAMFFLPAWL